MLAVQTGKISKNGGKFVKKNIVLTVICFFLLTSIVPEGLAQSTEDIVDKMIQAQGGKAALAKIEDATMSGTMELVSMGLSGSITMYVKEPNKTRMDMEFMGMIITQAYDGETAWAVDPNTGSTQELPEAQAKEMEKRSLGYGSLLNPEKYGITYTYKGKKTIEGQDFHVVEQAYKDGSTITMYLDTKTFLVHRVESTGFNEMGMEVDQVVFSSDYREVNGIMVAYETRILQDGEEAYAMSFTDVTFNSGLEDSLFKKEE
jgi:outer membrane lipoprotein-sorting protein